MSGPRVGDAHSKGYVRGKFCSIRTKPKAKCPCDARNNYIDNCWIDEATGTPDKGAQLANRKAHGFHQGKVPDSKPDDLKAKRKNFEAHHLLCVAEVTQHLSKNAKIRDVVKLTRWCINDAHNMLAMPVWGHTIMHYCKVHLQGQLKSGIKAPSFADTPMHNSDHVPYNLEIEMRVKTIANAITTLKQQHKPVKESDLVARLKKQSKKYREELEPGGPRGTRSSGTHEAWTLAMAGQDEGWYKPFSMAKKRRETPVAFPARGSSNDMASRIATVAANFKAWTR